jgi:hypothetical protein
LPRALQSIIIARISATHELTVDHRPKPDGEQINSDGARFHGEAEDLSDDEFVILFLGDSYTYGFDLSYDQAYPYQFESIAQSALCDQTIRVVNFGWTSSSPLLSLRLLREVGYKYRPDLVIYNLDMTDFHDDLRYEMILRKHQDFNFDQSEFMERLIRIHAPWANRFLPALQAITNRLRSNQHVDRQRLIASLGVPTPDERFFITAYPLTETQAGIEMGVMRNLNEMSDFIDNVLRAEMALVLYPRAYQYSATESPDNWEGNEYQRLGPHVQEPFRYFETVTKDLPYPVIDLLPRFEATHEFPLFFEADPHWNPAGATFVAERVYASLVEQHLIPCALDEAGQ